jgi:hypothetical protein
MERLRSEEAHHEAVRKRDALRVAVQVSGEVNVLLNLASNDEARSANLSRARTASASLDSLKPLFLSDDEIHQALHNLGQLAGVAVTPGLPIGPELWDMYLGATRIIGPALKRFESQAAGQVTVGKRFENILVPLGDALAGLGHVMVTFGPPADRERRYGAIEELLGDYERIKDRVYDLGDDQLVEAIRKEFREVRNDVLPRVKAALEKHHSAEEHGQHFRDSAYWGQVFHAEGGTLQWHGKHLRQLSQRLQGPLKDESPDGTWSPTKLRKIVDDYWREKVAYCPEDGARLAIRQDHSSGVARLIMVLCPRCKRKAANV